MLVVYSCDNKSKETPFMTVIKLQSAERNIDFEEAKKYIDVDKVYGDLGRGSLQPESILKICKIVLLSCILIKFIPETMLRKTWGISR